jgi:phospholipase/carboxylesterase
MRYLTLLFLAVATMVQAETTLLTDLPLKYLAVEPKGSNSSTPRPMIIFLHGYGSNEADLFELKQEFSPNYIYLSVQAPMMLAPGSYQWYGLQPAEQTQVAGNVLKHAKTLEDFISGAAKKYHTVADQVILVGFSQGAIMSYELALQHPQSVKGIVALSGKILAPLKEKLKPGLDLNGLSVFIGHGTLDDRVYYREATEALALLEKTSIKPAFHSYQKMGHSINQQELIDVKKWIEETLASKR